MVFVNIHIGVPLNQMLKASAEDLLRLVRNNGCAGRSACCGPSRPIKGCQDAKDDSFDIQGFHSRFSPRPRRPVGGAGAGRYLCCGARLRCRHPAWRSACARTCCDGVVRFNGRVIWQSSPQRDLPIFRPPNFADTEVTLEKLRRRIDVTDDYLRTFRAEQFDGSGERTISYNAGGASLQSCGQDYLLNFSLPNFYFHVVRPTTFSTTTGFPSANANISALAGSEWWGRAIRRCAGAELY